MSFVDQTDRQTDKKAKATFWAVTAYNDEIAILEDKSTYPSCVLSVSGGRELCQPSPEYPEGRLHFQGHIRLRQQQRLTWFKDWLPTAHLGAARSVIASEKYAMKSDTAAGEKTVRVNTVKYYSADEICLKIASLVLPEDIRETADHKVWYRRAVSRLLMEDIKTTAQVMNPSLKNFWCDYALVFLQKVKAAAERSEGEEEP